WWRDLYGSHTGYDFPLSTCPSGWQCHVFPYFFVTDGYLPTTKERPCRFQNGNTPGSSYHGWRYTWKSPTLLYIDCRIGNPIFYFGIYIGSIFLVKKGKNR